MEELDCRGTPELFDPSMATIYGVKSTRETDNRLDEVLVCRWR